MPAALTNADPVALAMCGEFCIKNADKILAVGELLVLQLHVPVF